MKKSISIFILMFLFIILPIEVYADNVEITGSQVRIRNLPGTNGNELKITAKGDIYPLLSNDKFQDQGGCSAGWYKVSIEGQEGYVCSLYAVIRTTSIPVISEEAKNACEQELKNNGFPEPYWEGLCNIKAVHPNWQFNAVQTGLDFSYAVTKESSCGKNTLQSSNPEYIDTSCNGSHDPGYIHPSPKAVAYYLNPLNFLDEKSVFMFEGQKTNSSISADTYTASSTNIFGNSFLIQQIPSLIGYVKVASETTGISQTALSTRIRQELGNARLSSGPYSGQLYSAVSGNYTTRYPDKVGPNNHSLDHYYNFYNIAAYDGTDVTHRALIYAYSHGWGGTGNQDADRQTAVTGGAQFLNNLYINQGQNTIYTQKFNINPTSASDLFVRQYMTNLDAPKSEAGIAYNAYKKANALENGFIFYIPIYTNLDAPIDNSPSGATGEEGDNTSNGLDIPSILTSVGYKLSENKIMGVEPNSSLDEFKTKISSLGGTVVSTSTDVLGTGNIIKISNGSSTADYVIVIKGDTSGDGLINALDLLQIQKNILGQYQLKDVNLLAGDPSGDSKVDALDLLQVQKNILGQYKIVQ